MSIPVIRISRAAVAALAACIALGAASFATSAEASIFPVPVPPPPTDATLEGSAELIVSPTPPSTPRKVLVTNIGSRAAGAFTVDVTPGDLRACGVAVVPGVRKVIDGLAAGETKSFYVSSSTADRIVTADYWKQVKEANESNNTRTLLGTDVIC